MKRLIILGSTGSIGTQTLEIVENNSEIFSVSCLTANTNWKLLAEQALKFRPFAVAIGEPEKAPLLRDALKNEKITVFSGKEGIREAASVDADTAVVALVGISGLIPTLTAIETGKEIALANKETLVVGGELVMKKAKEKNIPILPIDSEHSAIFQCLNGENRQSVQKIYLTSSGGPFRKLPLEEIRKKTAADALKHPTWDMGQKVTIDSSTLMNKGFEVIEARWLFDISPDRIEVIVHPQSIIHSMVEFIDGSIIAQLSTPDMRIPIQYALSYPERLDADFVTTDFIKIGNLTFEPPRTEDFPCLKYAFEAIRTGGTMPAVINGANEVAVNLFLQDKIKFMDIPGTIRQVMDNHKPVMNPELDDLLEADRYARNKACEINGVRFDTTC
jgi:1-deoxy-D-xylulose-5-phosphate reductoisomerase